MQRIGMGIEERADRGVALGHPRAFVEQARGLQEGRQLDLDALAAQRLQLAHRFAEQALRLARCRRTADPAGAARRSGRTLRLRSRSRRAAPGARRDRRRRRRPRPRAPAAHPRRSVRRSTWSRASGRPAPSPVLDSSPHVGLWPTRLLKAAGTRPEPAVSVPRRSSPAPARPRPPSPTTNRPTRTRDRSCCGRRRRASARPPARSRTGRDWSCRAESRRRRSSAAPRSALRCGV